MKTQFYLATVDDGLNFVHQTTKNKEEDIKAEILEVLFPTDSTRKIFLKKLRMCGDRTARISVEIGEIFWEIS